MKVNIHGIISIAIFFLGIIFSITAIYNESEIITIVYVALLLISFPVIIYSYCTKCAGRFNCAHVILGKLAQLMPKRKAGAYTPADYAGVLIPVIIIIAFPQLWLWKIKWMFVFFWLFTFIAVWEISRFVCTNCKNDRCVLCKNKRFR